MKQQCVEAETKNEAREQCPWAAVVAEVEGGYHCFESLADYQTWKNQI